MFSFDPKIPLEILAIQQWFASIITRPVDQESQMIPISPSGRPLSEEAKEYISPNLKLSSDKRIQIYNQQYWWRLLSILHQNFPTLTRLFGYVDFNNSIGVPFLTAYPSRHWAIDRLGDQLTLWIEEHYMAKDKPLVFFSAEIDWAYHALFIAPPSVHQESSLELLSKKIGLQKHLKLFALPFDLFSFRKQLVKETVEFWMDADFPPLPKEKKYFFVLYRNPQNLISYKEIEEGQWALLDLISRGLSLEEACDSLEKKGGDLYEEALSSLQIWIQEWIREKWLILQGE